MSQEVTVLMSAYMVLFLFFLAAFILLALIVHLLYVAHKKIKNTSRSNRCSNKAILGIIIVTLIGILSFFISVLLLIATVIQLLLVDSKGGGKSDDVAYSFESIEYLTVIFDQFGHLSMLTVFVIRLKICFEASVYGFSKAFMRFMYCCLILLMVGSFAIILQIMNHSNVEMIIISEIIWELATEGMMLWILYLFVSKLQSLVKMGLGRSRRNLRMTISYNISQKSRSRDNSRNHSRNNSMRQSKLSRTTNSQRDITLNRQPSPSPSPSPRSPSPNAKPKAIAKPNQTVLNSQNLVNVMTKMTLLVLIAVFGSIFSMIANIYIEIIELQTMSRDTAHIGTMWANVLPVFDMVLASFMLYLQFDFTKNVYNKMCSKWDILFIQFCGDLLSKRTAGEEKEKKSTVLSGSSNNNVSSIKKPHTPTTPSATSPRPNTKRLTLDITAITTEHTVTAFAPPSPSPSPIAESNTKPVSFHNAIRNNVAIQIQRPPPPPITPKSSSPTTHKGAGSGKINVSFWENAIANSSPKS